MVEVRGNAAAILIGISFFLAVFYCKLCFRVFWLFVTDNNKDVKKPISNNKVICK
jgi:hypothetical protein